MTATAVRTRTLYVKEVFLPTLKEKWGFLPALKRSNHYFIQCNAKGAVKWDTASVYTAQELIQKNNVKIIKDGKKAK